MTPSLVEQGQDLQLRRAVEEGLRLLETDGVQLRDQPPVPTRVERPTEAGNGGG